MNILSNCFYVYLLLRYLVLWLEFFSNKLKTCFYHYNIKKRDFYSLLLTNHGKYWNHCTFWRIERNSRCLKKKLNFIKSYFTYCYDKKKTNRNIPKLSEIFFLNIPTKYIIYFINQNKIVRINYFVVFIIHYKLLKITHQTFRFMF